MQMDFASRYFHYKHVGAFNGPQRSYRFVAIHLVITEHQQFLDVYTPALQIVGKRFLCYRGEVLRISF